MYRTPDGELTWNQFRGLPHIQRLPLQEQVKHYNSYLDNLASERMQFENWIRNQNKGPRGIVNIGLLAQEEFDFTSNDYFVVLQEDGSGIFVTALV